MKEVLEFLKECQTFYLATCEDGQPRVRPFGAVAEYEGNLYITTNNKKNVFKQLLSNPKFEISGMNKGKWIRLEGTAVHDDRLSAREKMLEENPSLSGMYSANDGLMEVLYIKDAAATICSFTEEPQVIKF
ncbi:pyridoxamine 5'-phosphate oxidase family protein [Anaerocolumna jejuensis]|uniref:pyridoxamine 5'-phosphate oxidase family protein n=1 Tax=Anaerocolumna jejuensis TaxID=259063 RepID=UPI003F7CBCEE